MLSLSRLQSILGILAILVIDYLAAIGIVNYIPCSPYYC